MTVRHFLLTSALLLSSAPILASASAPLFEPDMPALGLRCVAGLRELYVACGQQTASRCGAASGSERERAVARSLRRLLGVRAGAVVDSLSACSSAKQRAAHCQWLTSAQSWYASAPFRGLRDLRTLWRDAPRAPASCLRNGEAVRAAVRRIVNAHRE